MANQKLEDGTVHKLPADFRKAIQLDATAKNLWSDITPLARNEWICWVTSAKQEVTRKRRIEVGIDKMPMRESTSEMLLIFADLESRTPPNNHWSERVRAASVANSDALSRSRRSAVRRLNGSKQ